jgi:hypothetical protein
MNARLLIFAALLALSGASMAAESLPPDVLASFRSPTRVMLYSLDPRSRQEGTGFHDFRIVGFTAVEDAAVRQRLAATLQQHVQAGGGAGALCFNPHHGIRLIAGHTIHDILICYECGHVYIHSPGLGVRRVGVAGNMSYLDDVLTAAKVPLVPRRQPK